MRSKYFTSHKKLPIILILLMMASVSEAKKESKDTEIICFAAQNKWICAPENKQNIASEKAANLIKEHKSEIVETDVVIRSINIPKFNVTQPKRSNSTETIKINSKSENTTQKQQNEESISAAITETQLVEEARDNPYAKLWSHQLIGVSTHQSAINYVKQNQLNKDDVLIIKSTRSNMDWWIVLFGLYKDKQTGLDSEINLPTNVNNPWLRPLKNLVVNGFIEQY